jgi:hypothetical protein
VVKLTRMPSASPITAPTTRKKYVPLASLLAFIAANKYPCPTPGEQAPAGAVCPLEVLDAPLNSRAIRGFIVALTDQARRN